MIIQNPPLFIYHPPPQIQTQTQTQIQIQTQTQTQIHTTHTTHTIALAISLPNMVIRRLPKEVQRGVVGRGWGEEGGRVEKMEKIDCYLCVQMMDMPYGEEERFFYLFICI